MTDDTVVILSREVINELTHVLARISETCGSLSKELTLLEQRVGVGPMSSLKQSHDFLVDISKFLDRYSAIVDQL